jgi:hypothetical protein
MARGKRIGGLRIELRDITAVEHANEALRDAGYSDTGAKMRENIDAAIGWFTVAIEDLRAIKERIPK